MSEPMSKFFKSNEANQELIKYIQFRRQLDKEILWRSKEKGYQGPLGPLDH